MKIYVVFVVATENISVVITRNGADLTVLGWIKILVRSSYLEPTVEGTCMYVLYVYENLRVCIRLFIFIKVHSKNHKCCYRIKTKH